MIDWAWHPGFLIVNYSKDRAMRGRRDKGRRSHCAWPLETCSKAACGFTIIPSYQLMYPQEWRQSSSTINMRKTMANQSRN